MCQWVFKQNFKIGPQQIIRRLEPVELTVTNVSQLNKRHLFDSEIRDLIRDSIYLLEKEGKYSMEQDDFDTDSEDEDAFENIIPNADSLDSVGN